MAADDSYRLEADFIEAKNNWELEKLYVDLASAKGKALTPVEKKFLRGLLCGCSPAEIAKVVYQSGSSSTVRVYLSNGLYKYIEEMLSNQVGDSVKVKTWSRVTQLLEKAGYKKGWFNLQPINPIIDNKDMELDLLADKSILKDSSDQLIHGNVFHGRQLELTQVKEWILQQRCRLVVILGMAGIGKTAFSLKLIEDIKPQFEHVIWRSLQFAPPLELFLDQLIQQLSPASPATLPGIIDQKIAQLIDFLRSHRCLLVLDRLDGILEYSDRNSTTNTPTINQISYRQGYEGYAELISRIGNIEHQSCAILTSREKTQELAALEGIELPVHSLKLNGLNPQESIFLLKDKGLVNQSSQSDCQILIELYAGNPLFIKLIATTIQELFAGNIAEFIAQETRIFGNIRIIIEQQFNRLSQLEKQLLYFLSLQDNLQSIRELQQNLLLPGLSPPMSQRLILEAMELIQRRSLLDKQAFGLSLNPVLRKYILERLIEENAQWQADKDYNLLLSNTIFTEYFKQYLQNQHPKTQM